MAQTNGGVALDAWLKREKALNAKRPKDKQVTQDSLAKRIANESGKPMHQGTISAYIRGVYAPKSIAVRRAFQRICGIKAERWDEPADEVPAASVKGKAA